MAFLLLIPLIFVPLAELAVFVQVAAAVGLGPALIGIVLTAAIGALVMRAQGLATLTRARTSLQRQELPVRELFDGVCILVGGALLMLPGFLTDILGALLLLPPVRTFIRFALLRRIATHGVGPFRPPEAAGRTPGVIDVEFEEVRDAPQRDRPHLSRPEGDRR